MSAVVVTMEMQRGVCGDLAVLPHLRDAVTERGVTTAAARLLDAARTRDVPIVHCTVAYRPDRRGTPTNAPILSALARGGPGPMIEGAAGVELLPSLGPVASDIIEARRHGMSPFGGTSLDSTLRALGAETLVVVGVSLNIGIFGLVVEAVNHGYRVIVPRDAVVGIPAEYGEAVLANSISLLATVTTVDDVIAGAFTSGH